MDANMDVLHKALKWISHNRFLVLAMFIATALSVWLVGCQSVTPGLVDDVPVNRAGFERQAMVGLNTLELEGLAMMQQLEQHNVKVKQHNELVDQGLGDLNRQEAIKARVLEVGAGLVSAAVTGTVNPAQAITSVITLASILGVAGLSLDNRRKDGVIAEREVKAFKAGQAVGLRVQPGDEPEQA